MKSIHFRIDPSDLKKADAPGFVPLPASFEFTKGDNVVFVLDSGAKKTPLRIAARAKTGGRVSKPRALEQLVGVSGEDWRLEFAQLPEMKKVKKARIQPGFLLEQITGGLSPVVIIIYLPDDTPVSGSSGGDHTTVPCDKLALDIGFHQEHLSNLKKMKKGCETPSGSEGGPSGGGGGFGIGVTLDEDSADDATFICDNVDFWITVTESDLEDAQDEFNDRCRESGN